MMVKTEKGCCLGSCKYIFLRGPIENAVHELSLSFKSTIEHEMRSSQLLQSNSALCNASSLDDQVVKITCWLRLQ